MSELKFYIAVCFRLANPDYKVPLLQATARLTIMIQATFFYQTKEFRQGFDYELEYFWYDR